MKRLWILVALVSSQILYFDASGQLGNANSPFERQFQDVKFLDAYFGTINQKIEVTPGDKNVPFTVEFANVGSLDITGIRGQLQLPMGFTPASGRGALILANSQTEAVAGAHFYLTFYVNVDKNTAIQQYPGTVKVDYTRLREAGQRTSFHDFTFKVTGKSVLNVKALDPFLSSLKTNEVTIEVFNSGTAPLSNVRITLQNTQTTVSSTATPITNMENVVFDQNEWDVGVVDAGASKKFSFRVFIPENIRTQTLHTPLQITYFNAHGNKVTVDRTVDFFIHGLIDVKIYDVGVTEIAGKQTIIGDVINEGNINGLFAFITLEPLGDSNIKKTTQFVDELETDSPVPFNFPVEFEGEPKFGDHKIRITVRYKDDLRVEHVQTLDTIVTLYNTQKKSPPSISDYIPFMVVVSGAVAAGVVTKKLWKKKAPTSD